MKFSWIIPLVIGAKSTMTQWAIQFFPSTESVVSKTNTTDVTVFIGQQCLNASLPSMCFAFCTESAEYSLALISLFLVAPTPTILKDGRKLSHKLGLLIHT